MAFLSVLTAILTIISMMAVYVTMSFFAIVEIVIFYYSFFKRTIVLSKTREKLEIFEVREVICHVRGEEEPVFDKQASLAAFKEAMMLSKKDYKRIFKFSFVVFLILVMPFIVSFFVMMAEVATNGVVIQQLMKSGAWSFTFFMVNGVYLYIIFLFVAFSLPIFFLLHVRLHWRVKKMVKIVNNFT
ncbi:hypothetical protein [Bartonella florencae]|uniref:hypothetical protein n=1 Tax=Bartonella florencae TaxID=928210 RepID=UPI000558A5F4|nr:hypothetical protein [Bartonella florencae]